MFEYLKRRRAQRTRLELTYRDAQTLRQMGLNPDDFRDALSGRPSSLLFTPFRHPKDD